MRRQRSPGWDHVLVGDFALTPSLRVVIVEEILRDGRRRCKYLDSVNEEVCLKPSLLRVTSRPPKGALLQETRLKDFD